MSNASLIIIILLCFVILFSAYIINLKNILINSQNKVLDKFSTIDMELDSIVSMLPELIKAVNVKDTSISEINNLINKYSSLKNINAKIEYIHTLTKNINELFALVENYSNTKKDDTYHNLAKSISNHLDKIEYAISFYNKEGEKFNTLISTFPSNVIAKLSKYDKYLIYEDN